ARRSQQATAPLTRPCVTGPPYGPPPEPLPADPRRGQEHDRLTAGSGTGLSIRHGAPRPADKYKTCVPLLDLHAVANAFVEGEESEPETWVHVPHGRILRPGMFVTQMAGRAMET